MEEITLESLAKRVEALEKKIAEWNSPHARLMRALAARPPCEDIELVERVQAEIAAAREAEREAARAGDADEPHVVG